MNRMVWCVALGAIVIIKAEPNYATTLGRTHFIVGMPSETYSKYREQSVGDAQESTGLHDVHDILFSPDDDIHKKLLQLIQDETQSIKIAMYLFTDKDIAQALRDAQLRGVYIECVTDGSCISNKFNKMDQLAQHEIPVWVYRAANESKSLGNAMHHKFMIFGSSNKVVTGSLNITKSAQRNNQENIVILRDGKSVRRFGTQFNKLKTRCSRLIPQDRTTNSR
jgi:phosphatidylserine/phosphatidylglycerophosphate/cardiolipin synthase-like enzyme